MEGAEIGVLSGNTYGALFVVGFNSYVAIKRVNEPHFTAYEFSN